MKIAPLKSVECALLHDQFSPLDGRELIDIVSKAIQKSGISPQLSRIPTSDEHVHVLAGGYHVLVSQNRVPLAAEGFSGCVTLPITNMMMSDAGARVARHRANTFVTVGKGALPGASNVPFVNQIMGDQFSFTEWREAERAMKLCYAISRAVMKAGKVSCVHWCPSDHLVSTEFFADVEHGPSMTALYVRPYLFSSVGHLRSGMPVGMVGNGAQYLIGRPVVFNQAKVDLDWMITRVANFVDMCHLRGSVIPDGNSLGADQNEVIVVRHVAPTQDQPLGCYELTAQRVAKFGIDGPQVRPQSQVYYDPRKDPVTGQSRQLDPNDPIDRAIMARLEERQRLGLDKADEPQSLDRRATDRAGQQAGMETGAFGKRSTAFGKRQ